MSRPHRCPHCTTTDARARPRRCRPRGMLRTWSVLAATTVLLMAATAGPATADGSAGPPADSTSAGPPTDLDVLFVGAHPDDEASTLSTLGRWKDEQGIDSGVVTVTRGEGGGNAVGPEEGPGLALIREAEERRAVARGGVAGVYNLDVVDFYYTVSSPLTEEIWGRDNTLERVVRILRETRPEVVLTMNPAPAPGNHGHHQYAARLAAEAFYAAADPAAFPEQLSREGLQPWSASRLLLNTVGGTRPTGPGCASAVELTNPAQTVYGIYSGAPAPGGTTWAQVERDAQREYASQGWSGFPDVSADPEELSCDYFTQVDARVPAALPASPEAGSPFAALHGALLPAPGMVPLGTTMAVDAAEFRVVAGTQVEVAVPVRAGEQALSGAGVALRVPAGWQVEGSGKLGDVGPGQDATATFTVTAPADAAPGTRVRVGAELSTAAGTGWAEQEIEVSAPVRVETELLPQVAQYHEWAEEVGVPQLAGSVAPVLTLAAGGARDVAVVVTNESETPQSGTVELALPAGFATDAAASPFTDLPAGDSVTAVFGVRSTDASLPTSAEGGDYPYTLTTTTGSGGLSVVDAALELVPATAVPEAPAAPVVDGVESAGEYPGEQLDLSRRWEGEDCTSAQDCSASAKVVWFEDAVSVLIHVTDETRGTPLAAADCKRHWRTDSVEIVLDPQGTSENTSTTFKGLVLPYTAEGGPCFGRDADNNQGPGGQTAPGMVVASTLDGPSVGTGYTVEATIPLALLPADVDPAGLGMNLFVYDSDTQDKTGQTRLGWSTWQGVQGDPYRWGVAHLTGHEGGCCCAGCTGAPAAEPTIPTTALRSLDSPQSIAQSVADNVPLAGGPVASDEDAAWTTGAAQRGAEVVVTLRAGGPGTAVVTVWDDAGSRVVTTRTVDVEGPGERTVRLPLAADAGDVTGHRVLVGFEAQDGGTLSSEAVVQP